MKLRALWVAVFVALAVIAPAAAAPLTSDSITGAPAALRGKGDFWRDRIDAIVGDRPVGVAVSDGGKLLYRHSANAPRIPASNEKLLMSMALLSHLDPDEGLVTAVVTDASIDEVIDGNIWLFGTGDPTVTGGGRYGRALPFTPTRLGRLARRIKSAGITRIAGSVIGSTSYFEHDWFAPGWKSDFPSEEIPLPSALTFEGNVADGKHVQNPEERAAAALTKRLEKIGVKVGRAPAAGPLPEGPLGVAAAVRSQPLEVLLTYANRWSSNFFAEVLGKRLAVETGREPGTISGGAAAIEAFASALGVDLDANDASGLSYSNRVSAAGIVILLSSAEETTWGTSLRRSLAGAGQGTLENRLGGVRVKAKTGTLDEISALSGYVWLEKTESWAEFSILSGGLPKYTAVDIEDRIVRTLARFAY
ncbi:MAG TPA: D-alanyl-D-alanine carboxypeptidase [Actinomycetota bacterium]|nr:D-alanyl-D-alanine carboxypeptidase [Actinomycetota bacterium]